MAKSKLTPKLKAKILHAAKKHAWNMGVSNYTMGLLEATDDISRGGYHIEAEMDVDKRYLHAKLKVYPQFIKKAAKDDEFLNETIAHEMAHLVTQHFFDVATATYRGEEEMIDAWETCTEKISRLSLEIDRLMTKKK